MQNQIDLNRGLLEIIKTDHRFVGDLKKGMITGIAPGDGMFSGDEAYYLKCGRSALDAINIALKQAREDRTELDAVLDFACGFGRVTRWLIAAFPTARVVGMDTSLRAVRAVQSLYNISAHHIERDWVNVPKDKFDLIWVGSLFTHLNEEASRRLLSLLRELLTPNGVLAVTTHGEYVANRIATREKTYNLQESVIDRFLEDYRADRYGFAGYENNSDYGISVTSLQKFMDMGVEAKLQPLVSIERGWIQHQDFLAFCR